MPAKTGPTTPRGLGNDELFDSVYDTLHRLAVAHMGGERNDHTLQPTALVHEAYLRLMNGEASWESRRQFFGAAAEAMRRILIDHARRHGAQRRGGGRARERIDPDAVGAAATNLPDMLVLDEALLRMEEEDPRMAEVVKLKFFAGLSIADTARVMGVSPMTVKRSWACAKAWLHAEVFGDG